VFLFKGPKTRDAPGASPHHYGALVAMTFYIQGSGMPEIQINRMSPRPQRGQGCRKGGGGRSIKQEISRWNMSITLFFIDTLFKKHPRLFDPGPDQKRTFFICRK